MSERIVKRLLSAAIAIFLCALGLFAQPAVSRAATITVNTVADENGTNLAGCSLREAITAANTNSAYGGCPAGSGTDTIILPAGTYTLTLANAGGVNEDNNASGDLDILESLTIQGAGAGSTIIQAGTNTSNGIDKVIAVNPYCTAGVNVTIDGVTVRYGRNTQPYGAADFSYTGAGIDWCAGGSGETFTLSNAIVSDNTNVHGYGGGLNLDSLPGSTTVHITNVTFQNNVIANDATTSQGTGAGINIFTDHSTVNITNSTFSGNQALRTNAGGGAIAYRPTSNSSLQISASTFSNNSAQGSGGGVYFSGLTAGTTLSIQDSQFTNNTATASYGGGLYLANVPLNTTPYALTNLLITGNHAGGSGGGLYVGPGNLNMTNSRIVNNTATVSGSGLYKSVDAATTVSVANNWWGCSTGPSAAPCDVAATAGGPLTFTPWFRDLLSATTSPLAVNQSTALTASFLTNSSGGAVPTTSLAQIIGQTVTWAATLGTLIGSQTTVQAAGTATATFTAGSAGSAVISAQVDNDNTSGVSSNVLNLTINKADTTSVISTDTPDPSVVGQAVTVSYTVTGAFGNSPTAPTGNVTVSDGTSSCIGTVAAGSCNITLTTAGARTLTATYAGDTNFNGSVSTGVSHTVNQAPSITSATNTTFTVGSGGTFTVTTTGFPTGASMVITKTGALPSGVTFTDNNNGTATLAGTPGVGTGGTYPITITASNGVGTDATQSFTLTVNQAPAITSANTTTFTESVAGTFNVTTTGFPTGASMGISKTGALPTGVTFTDNGNGTATLAGTPALGTNGNYPITITANNGVAPNATQNFTLVVQPNLVITSANNTTFTVGSAGTFTVTTTGTPTPALSEIGTLPSGVTFTDNGNGTATLAGTPGAGTGGTYSITLTASNGVAPNATQSFTVTVNEAPSVTTQPPDRTTCAGGNIIFTAAAGGYPAPTVRWQLNTGSGFADISNGGVYSGAATPTLSITGATAGMTGYQYRAVFTNTLNSATTNAGTLTVLTTFSITVSNANDSGAGSLRQAIADICPGGTIDFSVTGTITLTSGELLIDKDLTIAGPGAANLSISGGGTVQLFQVTGATSFTLQNLTLADGAAAGGGALVADPAATTTITGCVFSGNMASIGGGAIVAAGTMTISDTYFGGNSTPVSYGGAIYADSGTMTIRNTLFSGNSAPGGGAIANNLAAMTLSNVTMNGNNATAAGGGIFAGGGSLDIVNATIAGNSAVQGGGIAVSGGTVNLKNSIVSDNTATSGPDILGTVTSQGYNLIGTTTDATINGDTTGNILGSDPLLGALADNGGPTQTMALLTGSPAINAAAGCPATDQRGISRPQGANCDIGAYEFVTRTTITLGSSQNPSVSGQSVTFTAAVADSETGSVPTGTVTFKDSGTTIGSGSLNGSAQTVFSTMSLTAGNHAITAEYGGDGSYEASTSAPLTQTVNQAATTATITSATPDPSVVGQAVTVAYTVTANPPGSGTPTGNVTVSDGVNNCTGTVAAGSCSLTLSTSGVRTLTATYAGDTNFNGSVSSGASHTVNSAGTTSTIASHTPDPSVVGQAVTVSYTVTVNPPGSGTPTGNVTVSDGVNNCTGTVAAGSCSLNLTISGARTLTATYAGAANFNGSVSSGASHTVNKAGTTSTITSHTPDPSVVGQAVTVAYAVVSVAPGSGTPTGNVTVSDGVNNCTGTVAAGFCSLTLTTSGARTLTATYAGDANFNGSVSSGASHTVNKAGTTSTIISHTPDPSVVGQAVTVAYMVTANPPGSGTPTGNVTVSDGVNNCTATVAAGSCSLTLTTSGTHTLTATYAGDTNFNGSSGTASHAVSFQYLLSVSKGGSGTVTGDRTGVEGNGINCGSDCSETFIQGTAVTLTATPANGWTFSGWSGDPDCSDGQITVNGPLNCIATFVLNNSVTIAAATGNGSITLTTGSAGCGFYNVAAKTEAQVGNDASYDYPYGLVEFTVNCAAADVTITFPGGITGTTYRKYGPTTPGNTATAAWYTFNHVTVNSSTSITLHLQDGQLGDDTGVDGIIVDEGGPGQPTKSIAAVPTMTEWGAIVLVVLLGIGPLFYLKRRNTLA